MVIDDEIDLLDVTKRMLEEEGYQVNAFSDPEQALQHFKKEDCKTCVLVVSDIRMPAMSGFELVRQIKETRPHTSVLLSSSFVIHKGGFEKVMPSMQIDDLVKKPFTTAELVEAIKKIGRPINLIRICFSIRAAPRGLKVLRYLPFVTLTKYLPQRFEKSVLAMAYSCEPRARCSLSAQRRCN